MQRGHVVSAVASLCANSTSPLSDRVQQLFWSVCEALLRHAQGLGSYIVSASQVIFRALTRRHGQSTRYRIVLDSYSLHLWHSPATATGFAALRVYIRPHCPQCPAVTTLKLRFVLVTAARPSGEGNRPYAKWPPLGTDAQPSALIGQFLPYAPPSVRPL